MLAFSANVADVGLAPSHTCSPPPENFHSVALTTILQVSFLCLVNS